MSSSLILAAVDGSPASVAALRWAVAEAHTHASHLQVITVYAPDETEKSQVRAERTQAAVVERVLGDGTANSQVAELATQVVAGDPVDVLTTWSAHAGLLVLGRHGTQSLLRNALGSVGDACSRLAACPVVIVPPPADESLDDSLAVTGT